MAGNYGIVDWIYNRLDDDDFIDEDTLNDKIRELDTEGKIEVWQEQYSGDNWLNESRSPSGIPLQTGLDEYIDRTALEEVESAKTIKELEKIKTEDEQVLSAIESKRIEIEEIEEEELEKEAEDIISLINKADTLSEIDAIDIDIEDSDARARAITEWNDRRFEIQEMIEEETGVFE